jgi:hypothetical protein
MMGRLRVDFAGGYVSFDDSERDRAWEFYRERGIRIVRCSDVFDEGIVVDGAPIVIDLTVE